MRECRAPHGHAGGIEAVQFHPDGLILGTGAGPMVRLWDVKSQANVAKCEDFANPVRTIDFSENGSVRQPFPWDPLRACWVVAVRARRRGGEGVSGVEMQLCRWDADLKRYARGMFTQTEVLCPHECASASLVL